MSKVRIKNADRHPLEAVSAWFAERLAKDPVIQKAMQGVENLSSENTDEISPLRYNIIGRASNTVSEVMIKKLLYDVRGVAPHLWSGTFPACRACGWQERDRVMASPISGYGAR